MGWAHQSNKTLLFWSCLILRKMKLFDLTPICCSGHTACGTKLRFCSYLAKTPNYLLWEIYAYRTIHMGLRLRYIFGNLIVKWIFLVFWSRDSEFWDQSTKYLHFSNSVKPDQTSRSKARNKGLYFCCFFSKVIGDFAPIFWQGASLRPLLIITREICEQWRWFPLWHIDFVGQIFKLIHHLSGKPSFDKFYSISREPRCRASMEGKRQQKKPQLIVRERRKTIDRK